MRLPILLAIAALAVVPTTGAMALPRDPAPAPAPVPAITPVAMGCGMGRTRDAMGRCHHRFNRFDQHRRFRAYKQTHCRPLRTPNGTVGFCKV